MSLNHIDRLFKSAFRTEEYAYKNAYWKDFESRLGPSKGGSKFGKILGAVAVLITGFSVSTDQLTITNSTTQNIAEFRIVKNETPINSLKDLQFKLVKSIESSNDHINVLLKETTENTAVAENFSRELNNSTDNFSIPPSTANRITAKTTTELASNKESVQNLNTGQEHNNSSSLLLEDIATRKFSKINSTKIAGLSYKSSPAELDGPLPDETEFGGKIKQSSLTQYYIQGGIYYLKLNPDIIDQNNIPEDFEKEFKSFNMSGGEILVGMKHKGFKVASGVGVSSISKTYAYKFNEEHENTIEKINSSTYLNNVDSSFSHYEINEFENGGNSNFDIATAVYNVDSNFVTVSDTTRTTSKEVTENNVALAYQLNYLNIPVQIGYEIEVKRFFVGVNAAIQLGVLTNYNGFKYNDKAENSRSIITSKDLNPVTLSYSVSVGAGYNITPTISVIAQPMYSSTLVGAFKDIKPNKISGLGGNLALRYQF